MALEGAAQPLDDLEPVVGPDPQVAGELVAAVPARGLGRVHGGVGVAQDVLGAVVVGAGPGDPHADRQRQAQPGHVEGPAEGAAHDLGPLGGTERIDDEDELVAAQPGEELAVAHDAQELGRHVADQLVADVVAEGVVDRLEPVEVEESTASGVVAGLQPDLELLQEAHAVGQPGQVVVPGPPGLDVGGVDPVGHVEVGHHDVVGAVDPGGLDLGPAGLAGLVRLRLVGRGLDGQIVGDEATVAGHEGAEVGEQARPRPPSVPSATVRVEGGEVAGPVPVEARPVEVGDLGPGLVGPPDGPVGGQQHGGDRQGVEDRRGGAGQVLAGLLEAAPLLDVAAEHHEPPVVGEEADLVPGVVGGVEGLEGGRAARRRGLLVVGPEGRVAQAGVRPPQLGAEEPRPGPPEQDLGRVVHEGEVPGAVEGEDGVAGEGDGQLGEPAHVHVPAGAQGPGRGESTVVDARSSGGGAALPRGMPRPSAAAPASGACRPHPSG